MMINSQVAESLFSGKYLVNLNNFVVAPSRTGIQRVCYELCLRWPHIDQTIPFIEVGMDKIGILPPEFFDVVRRWYEDED